MIRSGPIFWQVHTQIFLLYKRALIHHFREQLFHILQLSLQNKYHFDSTYCVPV